MKNNKKKDSSAVNTEQIKEQKTKEAVAAKQESDENKVVHKHRSSFRSVEETPNNRVPFAVVEAYKNIRIHLVSAMDEIGGKVIAFSSPNASEGKSTTVVNTAIILAQLNKKVLLLDSDIYRPSVNKKLKIPNEVGCCEVIAGGVRFDEAVQHYNKYLDVLTTGSTEQNPSDLFSTVEFDNLLSDLREQYDYIVIDTPPINLISDTLAIAQKSDGLVMVARSSVTTYESFRSALETLSQLNINIVGTVINASGAIRKQYRSYLKHGYNNYYKY